MATDPVCGMAVKKEKPPATSQVEDTVYYFCSMGCKVAFDHNPARYLVAQAGETAVPGPISRETIAPDKRRVLIHNVDLKKTYLRGRDKVQALRGVSFDLSDGELAVIMGPSGCGKSTLLHLLGGIDRPDSGQVVFDGQDLSQLRVAQAYHASGTRIHSESDLASPRSQRRFREGRYIMNPR